MKYFIVIFAMLLLLNGCAEKPGASSSAGGGKTDDGAPSPGPTPTPTPQPTKPFEVVYKGESIMQNAYYDVSPIESSNGKTYYQVRAYSKRPDWFCQEKLPYDMEGYITDFVFASLNETRAIVPSMEKVPGTVMLANKNWQHSGFEGSMKIAKKSDSEVSVTIAKATSQYEDAKMEGEFKAVVCNVLPPELAPFLVNQYYVFRPTDSSRTSYEGRVEIGFYQEHLHIWTYIDFGGTMDKNAGRINVSLRPHAGKLYAECQGMAQEKAEYKSGTLQASSLANDAVEDSCNPLVGKSLKLEVSSAGVVKVRINTKYGWYVGTPVN